MLKLAARTLLQSTRPIGAVVNRSGLNCATTRSIVTLKEVKYTARATASGQGRNGQVESDGLKLNMATPKELGGTGSGQNPEQLFAMGYASCLLGAIQLQAVRMGNVEMSKNAVVHTSVSLGEPNEMPGFGLAVDIKVEGVDEEVLKAGHAFCPYSRALTKGVVVNVSLA
ncbi:hypothetical protein AMATHDRAFT_73146 [Amanita thiersii Skay4041]|uniref:Organic hydroperoxide resistance protein n=1 Tax=Amanita thiersii Skay4041 TaxID=703135 RepID=A0A2A9P019_9AGAR|nr:hypothetical protein AMATHDRAFT_73146 [Amanita thiersii Skay4041]